jgi:GntR family transcriptional regulator
MDAGASHAITGLGGKHPRYLQLAQTLINEIARGQFPVGGLLPTELALCEQFGASRFTVRSAIGQLVQMRLVTRQAGVGTRVIATRPAVPGYRQVMRQLSDLERYTASAELEILGTKAIKVADGLCDLLSARQGELWLKADCLRWSDHSVAPISFTHVYIHPAFRAMNGLAGRTRVPIYRLIEQQYKERITEVRQEIRAVLLSTALARRLAAPIRSAALQVTRHYVNAGGEVIEVAVSTHPADRFTYAEIFNRDVEAEPS